jgi:hypothetical protein
MSILTVNLLLSTLIFWIAARLYLLLRLNQMRPQAAGGIRKGRPWSLLLTGMCGQPSHN